MPSLSALFELTSYAHRVLFEEDTHPWSALDRLGGYLDAHNEWGVYGEIAPGAIITGQVYIGPGTIIEPYATIIGPAIIGANCLIRHCAYLRGEVIVGDECVLGHCSEFKSSILLDRAKAPHFNYVGDSILGNDVNLGAGVICANLRLDGKPVSASLGKGYPRIPTNRRKLGAIVGDGVQVACNVVLDPGTIVDQGRKIYSPPAHPGKAAQIDSRLPVARQLARVE